MEKLNRIYYSEPGEGFTYCVLAPNVNGDEYVKKLNSRIVDFNKDIEGLNNIETELRAKHKVDYSFEKITGAERLNEREPKYPAELPKGVKSAKEAYPEITAERQRKAEINEKNWKVYTDFTSNAIEQVKLDLKPFKAELLEKWPEFKSWINGDSYDRTIYGEFILQASSLRYVTEDLV